MQHNLKPMFRTKLVQKSIQFRGPELWNEIILLELQDFPFNEFKAILKQICLHLNEEKTFTENFSRVKMTQMLESFYSVYTDTDVRVIFTLVGES